MNVGIAYAVLSALVFGVYLFIMKRWFTDYPSPVFLLLTYLLVPVVYLPVIFVSGEPVIPATNRVKILASVLAVTGLTAIGLLTLFRAIRIGEVSYVSPISKIVPVFVLPLEVGLLGQHLSPLQVGGVVVATTAVYVANWQGTALLAPLERAWQSRPAQLALLSAATFAFVDVGKRVLMQELSIEPTTYIPVMAVGVAALMSPLAFRYQVPSGWRADLPKFVVAAMFVAYANHIVLLSFQLLPASIVSPIVNGQAIVAVILGAVLLDESHFQARLAAAALAIVGIAMISVG
ncbi:DMT family transporter [Haloarcula sp. S1AR25-5A]|uniref:DMT family transporter n=1 Tax=Haloarcula terrestris TaxID=2950533 RepID=A0AAE4EWH1_9EURY|nr:DMT family transporter [Haloarcula terrestris]